MKIRAASHPLGAEWPACTGCAACAAVCHADAITMLPDAEGFTQPQTERAICTGCGLCRRVCPVGGTAPSSATAQASEPRQVLAAWHQDSALRSQSSSGGVFTALAQEILSRGGAVVGAAFDEEMAVCHRLVQDPAELSRLRGSKYVQSHFAPALHRQIRDLLELGRPLLFTGTPCQVAGLRGYLMRPYDTLYCCDLVCHGTPSPLFWRRYLLHSQGKEKGIAGYSFRDKRTGWKQSQVRLDLTDGRSRLSATLADPYMVAFLGNYSLRHCCYHCQFTKTSRYGDLTLADFWGVTGRYPEYDRDDRGTSLLLANSEKGLALLDACGASLFLGAADLETAVAGNPMLVRPSHRPAQRDTFYRDLSALSFPALVRKYRLAPPSRLRLFLGRLKRTIFHACLAG